MYSLGMDNAAALHLALWLCIYMYIYERNIFECEKLQYTAVCYLHYPQGSGYGRETLTPNANPLNI